MSLRRVRTSARPNRPHFDFNTFNLTSPWPHCSSDKEQLVEEEDDELKEVLDLRKIAVQLLQQEQQNRCVAPVPSSITWHWNTAHSLSFSFTALLKSMFLSTLSPSPHRVTCRSHPLPCLWAHSLVSQYPDRRFFPCVPKYHSISPHVTPFPPLQIKFCFTLLSLSLFLSLSLSLFTPVLTWSSLFPCSLPRLGYRTFDVRLLDGDR